MKAYRFFLFLLIILSTVQGWAQVTKVSLATPSPRADSTSTLDRSIKRFEIDFKKSPILEIELLDYVSSDVKTVVNFTRFGRLVYPLKTDEGEVIVPAETLVTMNVSVKPGRRIGSPGEIVFTLEPITLAAGKEGGRCLPETEIDDTSQFHQQLCQARWILVSSHRLHHLAVPEMGGAKILVVNSGDEGVRGFRSSRPPPMYDPSGERTYGMVQTAANRSLIGGLMFDVGSATFGVFRLIFSKRNLYLPTTTRLWFQLDTTVKLVRTSNSESKIRIFRSTSPPQGANVTKRTLPLE